MRAALVGGLLLAVGFIKGLLLPLDLRVEPVQRLLNITVERLECVTLPAGRIPLLLGRPAGAAGVVAGTVQAGRLGLDVFGRKVLPAVGTGRLTGEAVKCLPARLRLAAPLRGGPEILLRLPQSALGGL